MVSYAPLHILLVIFVLSTLIRISLAQNTSSNGSTFTPGTPLSQPPFTPPTSDAKTWADSFLAYTPHIIAAACLLAIAYFKWRLLANHVERLRPRAHRRRHRRRRQMNFEDGTELPVRHGNTPSDLEAGPDNSVGDDAALVEEDNGSMSEVAL